jgi:hypothetical protein
VKRKPPYNQSSAIRGALRRAFARSPLVQEKIAESRREVPKYRKDGSLAKKPSVQRQCEVCEEWVGSTKIVIDHKNPVVSVEQGFQDWNEFILRLWCNKSNIQRICKACHYGKTYEERIARLTKQYTVELGRLAELINNAAVCPDDTTLSNLKVWKKQLAKYIAKKKTKGLEGVVQQAQALKNKIERWTIDVKP